MSCEVLSTRGKATTVVLPNGHTGPVKLLLNLYAYTYPGVLLPALVRELCFTVDSGNCWDSELVNTVRVCECQVFISKQDFYINPSKDQGKQPKRQEKKWTEDREKAGRKPLARHDIPLHPLTHSICSYTCKTWTILSMDKGSWTT